MSPIEVLRIAAWVRKQPPTRQTEIRVRIAEVLERGVENLTEDERAVDLIPCPLLEPVTKRCLAYEVRPIACRKHFSQAREACESPTTRMLFYRSHRCGMNVGVALKRGLADSGLEAKPVELVSGLSRALEHPDAAERWVAGERVFGGRASTR